MRALNTLCVIMLVLGALTLAACSSTSRYVASSEDIQKFEKKEAKRLHKTRTTQK